MSGPIWTVRRVQDPLRAKKTNQEAQLSKLEQSRTKLRANAENISERYADIRDRGASLAVRVEAVLSPLQTWVPLASHAELKMARDLKMLEAKMEQVELATNQLKVYDLSILCWSCKVGLVT